MSKKNRKQQVIQEMAEIANIVPAKTLTEEDFIAIADRCYHNNEATEIGTYSAVLKKYAVHYQNKWIFIVYNRDKNKTGNEIPYDLLNDAEKQKYVYYRNRLEAMLRIQRTKSTTEK